MTENYKGFYILFDLYGQREYSVFDSGNVLWFRSVTEAKNYIDSIAA